MGISLNYTTIDPAETKNNWETVGNGSNIADSNYPPKQGNQCIEFEIGPNREGGVRNKNATTPFSIKTYEVGFWILNPKKDKNSDDVVANQEDGIFLRLYSSNGNYADYFQPQHRLKDGTWKGGWLYLRASGGPGDEDRNSGTWTDNDCENINKVAVIINSGNGDTTDKDSGKFGVDWAKYYDKIIITGDNSNNPWTLEDIYNTDKDKDSGGGVWGVVEKSVDFYRFFCGLQFGDGNSGKFKSENEYIYLDQLNETQKFHILLKENFELTLGEKEIKEEIYVKKGINITANGYPDFNVEDNTALNIFDTKIQGFNQIYFGNGNSTSIEIIKSDFYNNKYIIFNGSGIIIEKTRIYSDKDKSFDGGEINNLQKMKNVNVFNLNNGLIFNNNFLIEKYKCENNIYDIIVKDGKEVTLLNSYFSSMKRIT